VTESNKPIADIYYGSGWVCIEPTARLFYGADYTFSYMAVRDKAYGKFD
jgi:hypothetical protein